MTGRLTLSNKGLKIKNSNKDSMTLMTSSDRYSHVFYNAKTDTSESKLDYNSTKNIWQFNNVNDVTINDKSVLKAGDFGIGSTEGAPLSNANDILLTGFYGTDAFDRPGLPDLGYDNYYSTLAVYGTGSRFGGHVEQLYVPTLKGPRTLSRSVFSQTEKMNWIESVTEANIDRFVIPVGVPLPWPRSFVPEGYLWCNGASFDTKKYPKLSNLYWDGKLPDLRNWDNSRNKDLPDSNDISFIYIVKAK